MKLVSKKLLPLLILPLLLVLSVPLAFGDSDQNPLTRLAIALEAFVQGQGELILQNDQILQQNEEIITLLKGDKNVYVAGVTERYDLRQYQNAGICTYYDRLLQIEIENGSCPITNLTKDQFDSIVNGQAEN